MNIEGQSEHSPREVSSRKITRRVFLTALAAIAGGLIAKKIFKEKPAQIPENEKSTDAPFHSVYFWAALQEVRKKHPEQEAKVRDILTNTDQQGADNIAVFHPDNDPNLGFPFTKVSVSQAINGAGIDQNSSAKKKLIYMIFTGFANPPAGHPFTPWDMVYDRVINSIPGVSSGSKEVEVYSLGYPQGLGGQVSKDYLEGIDKGTDAYGKLYGEFVSKVLSSNDPDTRIILQGMSFGSSVAELAFRNLTKEQQGKARLLLDNPVADHGAVDIKLYK